MCVGGGGGHIDGSQVLLLRTADCEGAVAVSASCAVASLYCNARHSGIRCGVYRYCTACVVRNCAMFV